MLFSSSIIYLFPFHEGPAKILFFFSLMAVLLIEQFRVYYENFEDEVKTGL